MADDDLIYISRGDLLFILEELHNVAESLSGLRRQTSIVEILRCRVEDALAKADSDTTPATGISTDDLQASRFDTVPASDWARKT